MKCPKCSRRRKITSYVLKGEEMRMCRKCRHHWTVQPKKKES